MTPSPVAAIVRRRERPRADPAALARSLLVRSSKTIHVVSAHAEGEVGDVIVGGVLPPPGATLWEQSR